jgi:uncharacterized membrane protein
MAKVAVRRSFEVVAPVDDAWRRLAEVERWPEWAPHIRSVTVSPTGPLGPSSSGVLHVRRLGRTTFRMSAWEPPRRWEWAGSLPGARVTYDHRFEASGDEATTMTWTVSLEGSLAWLIRPVFARVYGRNVDRAIPRLQTWIRT